MNKLLKKISELKNPYFDLQAEIGITKHMGGFEATRELIDLCHIGKNKHILDVGCSVGRTMCSIAKRYNCRVIGVDISERMIERAKERSKREGVKNRVGFLIADVQSLPFEKDLFNAVISESVTAFPDNKQKAISDYVRVTKPGGYVGLNEVTWIKTEPPEELVECLYKAAGGIKPETSDGWKELLEGAGLKDIMVKPYKITMIKQFINEVRQIRFADISKAWYRLLNLYIISHAYRKAIKEMIIDTRNMPKRKIMFKYWGYGIYVGRK
ncbi:MAG: class I SAM-dependent methyltransferase [Candidatus Marinimicrobia bacterium]|nr:class I SAM-dependent methyltransferase [Candidatus Neomarinimicrobiota bacterium]